MRERIQKTQRKDEGVVRAVEELKNAGIKSLKEKGWSIEEGIVCRESRIYVLEGELRIEII